MIHNENSVFYVVNTPSIGKLLCCGHCKKQLETIKQILAHFKLKCSALSTVIIQHYRALKMVYSSLFWTSAIL